MSNHEHNHGEHECTCFPGFKHDVLIPQIGIITDIREETPDVKTFRVNAPEGGKLFEHMPGQCAMLCGPGVSEGMFSITSSPTNQEYQEFSIKRCGMLTEMLHSLEVWWHRTALYCGRFRMAQ